MQETLYDNEAERCLLGSIFVKPSILPDVTATVRENEFYRVHHQTIYAAMLQLLTSNGNIDIVTLSEQLRHNGELEKIGGIAEVTGLAREMPTAAYWRDYARIVKDYAARRQVRELGNRIAAIASDLSQDMALDDTLAEVSAVAAGDVPEGNEQSMAETCADFLGWLSERSQCEANGVQTGYPALDDILQGIEPGDMCVLAAKTSMGKTAFALNIALNAAQAGHCVAFYSLEMSREQVMTRLTAMLSGVPASRIKNSRYLGNGEWEAITQAGQNLSQLPLYIMDNTGRAPGKLLSSIRRIKAKRPVGLVVVDYLQHMDSGRAKDENETVRVGYISARLKAIAMQEHVPLLVISQLSRANDSRSDKTPILSDLRSSGNIEQDADTVIFLHRNGYYDKSDTSGVTKAIVAKARNGSCGECNLTFLPQITRFVSASPLDGEPVKGKDIPL